jgi:outer membrane protein insertion porin family
MRSNLMNKFIAAIIIFFRLFIFNLPAQELRLKSIEFQGNKIIPDNELLSQMNTQPKTRIQKIFFWKKKPDFIYSVLEEDITRIDSYYKRNGFLNSVIDFTTDTSSNKVNVTIRISENSFVKVRSIDFNITGDSTVSSLGDSLISDLPLKQNARFTDRDVFDSEKIIKKRFSDRGYPLVNASHEIILSQDTLFCDVTFNIKTGSKSYFGNVFINGDTLIPEKFIRKYLLFSEGDLFSQKKIDKTQQDIFGTDLFRYVVMTPVKDSIQNDRIPVGILLKELPRWQLETGVGYGTEDRLRLAAQVTKLNFLGGARRLIVNAKTSYFLPFSFDIRFVQPDILFPKLDMVLNPFISREREISYTIDRMGSIVSLLYRLSRNLDARVSYTFERDRIRELSDIQLDPSELKHNKSVISSGINVNSSDDPFYPKKGYRLKADVSFAGLGSVSAVHYYKLDFSLVNYFAVDNEVTLATKISSGVIQAVGKSLLTPVEERYYLGGASSLRGWGRHRISPVTESGFATGGNTMAEGSIELRFPVYDILQGGVFADAGNVWSAAYHYDLLLLHYDAGFGLRVKTPIGPVRLDLATPVINDRFNLQFFISVGYAF